MSKVSVLVIMILLKEAMVNGIWYQLTNNYTHFLFYLTCLKGPKKISKYHKLIKYLPYCFLYCAIKTTQTFIITKIKNFLAVLYYMTFHFHF